MKIIMNAIKLTQSALSLPKKILDGVNNALDIDANAMIEDYRVVTQTWKNKPDFKIKKFIFSRQIYTESKIFGYVDKGTRVRHALMSRNFSPKTKPNWIGSRAGRGGAIFVSRKIIRPGIEARNFTKTIRKKWDAEFPRSVQRAINSVVK